MTTGSPPDPWTSSFLGLDPWHTLLTFGFLRSLAELSVIGQIDTWFPLNSLPIKVSKKRKKERYLREGEGVLHYNTRERECGRANAGCLAIGCGNGSGVWTANPAGAAVPLQKLPTHIPVKRLNCNRDHFRNTDQFRARNGLAKSRQLNWGHLSACRGEPGPESGCILCQGLLASL